MKAIDTVDITAQRMNFLKWGRKGLTYGSLLAVAAALFTILFAWYASGIVRVYMAKRHYAALQKSIAELNAEKDVRLSSIQLLGKKQIGSSAQEELLNVFSTTPRWSLILQELAVRLPRQVKLTAIRSELNASTDEQKLILTGQTNSAKAITVFVAALKRTSICRSAELVDSKQLEGETKRLEFTIAAVLADEGR